MDFFNKLFGFPSSQNPENPHHQRRFGVVDFWDGIFHNGQEEQSRPRESQSFVDPFAMHEFFHEQVNNFFKHFGMPMLGSFNFPEIPSITDGNVTEDYPSDSRESFLKKGAPTYQEKTDQDLDGKLSKLDIDKFFQKTDSEDKIVEPKFTKPFSRIFSQSVQVEAITKPDGSMEIRKVVTDSEGNKKVTITQRMGDKEYTFNY